MCAHTLLFPFTVQKYVYPPVSKEHAGSLRVSLIHRTLTWSTWSLACVRDHSCIHTGYGHTDSESAQHLWLGKALTFFPCAPEAGGVRTSDLWISNQTSNTLPPELPHHPWMSVFGVYDYFCYDNRNVSLETGLRLEACTVLTLVTNTPLTSRNMRTK